MNNWKNFLKNRGEWRGNFTQVSPSGELLDSVASILTIEVFEDDRLALFRLNRYGAGGYSEPPISEIVHEYRSIGRQNIFFDTGAFSKGTIQLAPFSEFVAEFGLINENRRLRFVQLFDTEHHFTRLVLIRELRHLSTTPERPPLTVEQLLGVWEGEAVTAYADLRTPEAYKTHLKIQQIAPDRIEQTLSWDSHTISSRGSIGTNKLHFGEEKNAREILLLPDGGSSNTPVQIQRHQPFFVEAGWLVSTRDRQRLIRNYTEKGEWVSSTHIIEHKIDS
jgi:Domain of unknown function (DUF3598)